MGGEYGDRPALIGEAESYSFSGLAARINRYSRWALAQERRERRDGRADDGQPAGIRRDLAGADANRRRRGADRPRSRRRRARRTRSRSRAPRLAIASPEARRRPADAVSTARIWTPGRASAARRTVDAHSGAPISPTDDAPRGRRSPTAPCASSPPARRACRRRRRSATASDRSGRHWFAGLAGLDAGGSALQLPADASQRRRRGRRRRAAGRRRLGAIAPRFSASRFWDDVARWDCTAFQYIGELCRYLVAAPTHARERRTNSGSRSAMAWRRRVWRAFAERFPAVRVLEFYASTEGNVWLYNVGDASARSAGCRRSSRRKAPIALVRFDEDAQAPARGRGRFLPAVRGRRDRRGAGRIGGDAASRFEGYSDAAETEKKILRDVFAPGDAWMRTGDLMRRDAEGFYDFVDRVGDTFRWKGENVAAPEVAARAAACPGVTDAMVYGVKVEAPRGPRRHGARCAGAVRWTRAGAAARGAAALGASGVSAADGRDRAHGDVQAEAGALCRAEASIPRRCEDRLFVLGDNGYRPLDAAVFDKSSTAPCGFDVWRNSQASPPIFSIPLHRAISSSIARSDALSYGCLQNFPASDRCRGSKY